MKHLTITLILSAIVFIAGCAHPYSKGTLIEQKRIQPKAKITILWDLGTFKDSNVNQVMSRYGAYSKSFESCTNAIFERTFSKNGQSVQVLKVPKADIKEVHVDSPYVFVLHNTKAHYQYREAGAGAVLDVEGLLYETETGHKLWSVESWLSPNADVNSHPALQLVRGLAANGFLNLKIEEISDYLGVIPASPREVSIGCPE